MAQIQVSIQITDAPDNKQGSRSLASCEASSPVRDRTLNLSEWSQCRRESREVSEERAQELRVRRGRLQERRMQLVHKGAGRNPNRRHLRQHCLGRAQGSGRIKEGASYGGQWRWNVRIRLDFVFNFVKLNDVYRARREWRQKVLVWGGLKVTQGREGERGKKGSHCGLLSAKGQVKGHALISLPLPSPLSSLPHRALRYFEKGPG